MKWPFGKRTYLPQSALVRDRVLPRLSFCISHKDRFDALQKTLPVNLRDNSQLADQIEFILVDFGSADDVDGWVSQTFSEALATGYLKYFKASGLDEWHASVAKNTVHAQASGAILMNLDCDNFTGPNGADYVIDAFEKHAEDIVFWQYSKKKLDGTFGRIALSRERFHALGGYDESLLQMGYQDGDLKDRALAMGARLVHDRNPLYNRAIPNDKFVPQAMTWKAMNEQNERTSRENVKAGRLVANGGVFGRKLDVKKRDITTSMWVPLNSPQS